MYSQLFWIALAGATGTLARYGLHQLIPRWNGHSFPWSTLFANVLGCFFFGWIWMWTERKLLDNTEIRLIVLTGFMGAFTTYSTFAFETGQMLRAGQLWLAFGNFSAQTVLGFSALFLGLAMGRAI